MANIKVSHFREKCIGCGICANLAPENWELDNNDGKANLIGSKWNKRCFSGTIPELFLDENIDVADQCPVEIIKIHHEN